jgi:hypothetical protein
MALKQGETYSCPDQDCGCEITVTREARRSQGVHDHRCCCGREMQLKPKT